jgi:hypothetical protein
MKITKFRIKKYKGIAIKIGRFKFETIYLRNKRMIRLEWSNWRD